MRLFSTFKIARGRGWRREGIGSDERQWGGREGSKGGDDEGGTHLMAVYPALI